MKSRILLGAALLTLAVGSAFAAKGDPSSLVTRVSQGPGAPDGVPTVTFNASIAPNNTTTSCPTTAGAQPAPGEPVISLNIGPNAVVTGFGFDTTQTAFDPSWLSEMAIVFYSSAGAQFFVTPGVGIDMPGGPTVFSSNGVIDLTDSTPIPNLTVGPDGILRLGLCETFNDAAVVIDGTFSVPSTMTVACNNCVDPTGPPPGADLALTQSNNAGGSALLIGNTFEKTLTVTNNGPSTATAITVTDTLPPQLTFVSSTCGAVATGQTVTYTIPSIANGSANNCVLTVRVASAGTITNTATITSSTPADPTAANNTTTAQIGPTGGGIAQTPVPALDRNMLLVLLGLVTLFGAIAMRQRQA